MAVEGKDESPRPSARIADAAFDAFAMAFALLIICGSTDRLAGGSCVAVQGIADPSRWIAPGYMALKWLRGSTVYSSCSRYGCMERMTVQVSIRRVVIIYSPDGMRRLPQLQGGWRESMDGSERLMVGLQQECGCNL